MSTFAYEGVVPPTSLVANSKEASSVANGAKSGLPSLISLNNEKLLVTPWWRVGLVSHLFNQGGNQ
ncbi:hypothetical protein PHJA_002581100 [Phtheirospermum japonicum]|uniref:Uncharacterized protein n=1 Tax=Phtheirospermum japonicum TaxID=374723 RepID=A0A830DDF8_9LAMI|nr:hypothetical protein PHJA_002581100 [Phtheirospermum japonicum]